VAAGVGAPAWPGITALALTIWIGAWAPANGAMEIGLAFQQGEKPGERALLVLSGLVSIARAFVLFVRPDIRAVSLPPSSGCSASSTASRASSRPSRRVASSRTSAVPSR